MPDGATVSRDAAGAASPEQLAHAHALVLPRHSTHADAAAVSLDVRSYSWADTERKGLNRGPRYGPS